MTLQSPAWLWALVALPLLAAGLALWMRSSRRAARAWADPALLDARPPRRARALRACAAAVALLAVAAGALAMARPSVAQTGEEERSTVVVALDISNSMLYRDVAPTRMEAALDVVDRLLDGAPESTAAGIVTFADFARVRLAPTADLAQVRRTLRQIGREPTREGTTLGEAIVASLGALSAAGASGPDGDQAGGRILLVTDGADSIRRALRPQAAAERAAAAGVPIYPIMLGDDPGHRDMPPPTETLALIAATTNGVFLQSTTSEDLQEVFADLRAVVTPVERMRELTVWLAVAAVLLLVAGALLLALARPGPRRPGPAGAA